MSVPAAIKDFVKEVMAQLPGSTLTWDAPSADEGEWFLDVTCDGFKVTVAWRPSSGFGFFTGELAYGDRPNEVFRTHQLAAKRVAQLSKQWRDTRKVTSLGLTQLRQLLGTPQTQLAEALSCNQPAISRVENRDDVRLSTLVSYVNAIGGRLELRVHFDELDATLSVGPIQNRGSR